MGKSPKELLMELPHSKRQEVVNSLTEKEASALLNSWRFTARPEQLCPEGKWSCWLILAGRGFGKTRTAAELVIEEVINGNARRIALVGRTAADVRDVMVEGESGILACAERAGISAVYESSKRRITFGNGAIATTYSAEEPSLLRGPEHDFYWADELAAWKSSKGVEGISKAEEAWANLMMGLRIGKNPRGIVTTTPRPVPLVKMLRDDESTHLTVGSTFDNRSNLHSKYIEEVKRRYEGTRIGRQELFGEVLDDVEGALWNLRLIEDHRRDTAPHLARVVVAIDPATSTNASSDFTAITVSGLGVDDHFYVLHSEQLKVSPAAWAKRALDLFDQFEADKIVAEKNNGGDMVVHTIKTERRNAPVEAIHASRGKQVRAEPVVALYEQGKVHHVKNHKDLEDQMILFPVASEHDDLVDSLVYSISELDPSNKQEAGRFVAFDNKGRAVRRRR